MFINTITHKKRNFQSSPSSSPSSPKDGGARAKVKALKPEDVDEVVWRDFSALRKAKRAPLTETALEGIRREAEKAGWTLGEAIEYCCVRGWQGVEAKWLERIPKKRQERVYDDIW